ncbi:hypothetical protein [Brevundimonas sp.]|uniref:hypothetical protein n=1 Tax=Brevundimonas sp. TaxID=1871086 RepID=UPI0025E8BA8F|nr:hypothetical protein [Brevundimonas sp.]
MTANFVKLTHLESIAGTNQPVLVALDRILYIERDIDGSLIWLSNGAGQPVQVRVRERPLVVAERLGLSTVPAALTKPTSSRSR